MLSDLTLCVLLVCNRCLNSNLVLIWLSRGRSDSSYPVPRLAVFLQQQELSSTFIMEVQFSQQHRAMHPRRLEQQESLNSLNQWSITFKNFYRRCQYYGYFLQPNLTWTTDVSTNRGLQAEATGLKRTPDILASDLEGFLQCLSGYLPFDYVADKLVSETTCMKSVWDIIYEIYDVEINTTHFLDYASMSRSPGETYRGFF